MHPQNFPHGAAGAGAGGQHNNLLPSHLAGMSGGQLAGLAGLSGPAAMQAMVAMSQAAGQNNIPPPPGGLGSGLLALGSVAGALVGGHNNYQYPGKDDKENDRTVCKNKFLEIYF